MKLLRFLQCGMSVKQQAYTEKVLSYSIDPGPQPVPNWACFQAHFLRHLSAIATRAPPAQAPAPACLAILPAPSSTDPSYAKVRAEAQPLPRNPRP